MSINITLPADLGKFVEEQIRSGKFSNPSDVVGNALMTVKAQEINRPEATPELLKEIAIGVDEFERGNYAPWNLEEMKEMLSEPVIDNNL